jgi:hypothetical protein
MEPTKNVEAIKASRTKKMNQLKDVAKKRAVQNRAAVKDALRAVYDPDFVKQAHEEAREKVRAARGLVKTAADEVFDKNYTGKLLGELIAKDRHFENKRKKESQETTKNQESVSSSQLSLLDDEVKPIGPETVEAIVDWLEKSPEAWRVVPNSGEYNYSNFGWVGGLKNYFYPCAVVVDSDEYTLTIRLRLKSPYKIAEHPELFRRMQRDYSREIRVFKAPHLHEIKHFNLVNLFLNVRSWKSPDGLNFNVLVCSAMDLTPMEFRDSVRRGVHEDLILSLFDDLPAIDNANTVGKLAGFVEEAKFIPDSNALLKNNKGELCPRDHRISFRLKISDQEYINCQLAGRLLNNWIQDELVPELKDQNGKKPTTEEIADASVRALYPHKSAIAHEVCYIRPVNFKIEDTKIPGNIVMVLDLPKSIREPRHIKRSLIKNNQAAVNFFEAKRLYDEQKDQIMRERMIQERKDKTLSV